MFQFRRFPACAYLFQRRLLEFSSSGFPHSVIPGSTRMCRSPRLIAACHDLHRLLMPRHSPCALISLTFGASSSHLVLLNHAVHRSCQFYWLNCFTLFLNSFRHLSSSTTLLLNCPLLLALHTRIYVVQFSRCLLPASFS